MSHPQVCPCGSGLYPSAQHDARGIFLFYACNKCEREKLKAVRPEVLTDPCYDADEPIDGDDWFEEGR